MSKPSLRAILEALQVRRAGDVVFRIGPDPFPFLRLFILLTSLREPRSNFFVHPLPVHIVS